MHRDLRRDLRADLRRDLRLLRRDLRLLRRDLRLLRCRDLRRDLRRELRADLRRDLRLDLRRDLRLDLRRDLRLLRDPNPTALGLALSYFHPFEHERPLERHLTPLQAQMEVFLLRRDRFLEDLRLLRDFLDFLLDFRFFFAYHLNDRDLPLFSDTYMLPSLPFFVMPGQALPGYGGLLRMVYFLVVCLTHDFLDGMVGICCFTSTPTLFCF